MKIVYFPIFLYRSIQSKSSHNHRTPLNYSCWQDLLHWEIGDLFKGMEKGEKIITYRESR